MNHQLQAPGEQYSIPQQEFSEPVFQANTELTLGQGSVVDVSQYEPLLTSEEATAQMGFVTGPLQAVVRLPYKYSFFADRKTPSAMNGNEQFAEFLSEDAAELGRRMNNATVFCFKAPESNGRHKNPDEPAYYLMGIEQVKQLREQALYGPSSLPETSGGVIGLSRGQTLPIGREDGSWLPNVGWDYPLLRKHDDELRDQFSAVSHQQAVAWVGENGQLLVQRSEKSRNHLVPTMFLEVGRPISHLEVSPQ